MADEYIHIDKSTQSTGLCKFILDDKTVLDAMNLEDFNSYRNWGSFPGSIDPIWEANAKDNNKVELGYHNFNVTKSLFNNVQGIGAYTEYQMKSNAPLIDSPRTRKEIKADDDCSVKALVTKSEKNQMGRQIYRYADFMYCKYLGQVPNNYMITLRRFPYPCADHIGFIGDGSDENEHKLQKHMPDMGRMITWLGTPGNDITNILHYKVTMPFKEMTAKMEDGGNAGGDSGGLLGTLMNMGGNSAYQSAVLSGHAGSASNKFIGQVLGSGVSKYLDNPPYEGMVGAVDNNKPWGPIDVIKKTHIRGDDGLVFENSFDLTFDYKLRSYDGVNGKAAFLDLIANILAVTYSTGKFWGGGYRGSGLSQHNAFANLPIYNIKNGASWSEVMGAVTESLSEVGKAMNGNKELTGNFLADAKSILSNMGKQFAQAILGGALNKLGRPMKNAVNSLLSPAPVGFWHVTVGNPMHPIIQMGNMIIDNCEITQYGPLGLDDFPTGLKVKVTLKHAKSRDATLFEQMFHYGEYRIYSPIDKLVQQAYENSTRPGTATTVNKFSYIHELNKAYEKGEDINPPSTGTNVSATTSENTASDIMGTQLSTSNDNIPANKLNNGAAIKRLQASINSLSDLYIKHFGTKDAKNIYWTSREGAHGAAKKEEQKK